MAPRPVTIRHPETGGTATVPPHLVATWAREGWELVDDDPVAGEAPTPPPVSGRGATVAAWRTYALAVGGDAELVEAMTKPQLIAAFATSAAAPVEASAPDEPPAPAPAGDGTPIDGQPADEHQVPTGDTPEGS